MKKLALLSVVFIFITFGVASCVQDDDNDHYIENAEDIGKDEIKEGDI